MTSSTEDKEDDVQLNVEDLFETISNRSDGTNVDGASCHNGVLLRQGSDTEDDEEAAIAEEEADQVGDLPFDDAEMDNLGDDLVPPLPPDGGWGWVVVAASFMTFLIVDGMVNAFGILMLELLDHFNSSTGKTALVGSMISGMTMITGPVASALVNRFGCRAVGVAGSIIASASIIISQFSPTIEVMILTYGVMAGFGTGLMCLSCIVMISMYFDKRRAMATGISFSGNGFGTFICAPLVSFLLAEYGWKGNNFIVGAIFMHCIAFTMLLRPLQPVRMTPVTGDGRTGDRPTQRQHRSAVFRNIIRAKNINRMFSSGSLDNTMITSDNRILRMSPGSITSANFLHPIPEQIAEEPELEESESDDVVPVPVSPSPGGFLAPVLEGTSVPFSTLSATPADSTLAAMMSTSPSTQPAQAQGSVMSLAQRKQQLEKVRGSIARPRYTSISSRSSFGRSIAVGDNLTMTEQKRLKRQLSSPFIRQDIFFTGSVTTLQEYKESVNMATYVQSHMSLAGVEAVDGSVVNVSGYTAVCGIFRQMFDFSLLLSPTFLVICLSGILPYLGALTPFVFVQQKAVYELGESTSRASLILSILGIFNTVGRLGSGWLADQKWADAVLIHNVAMILGGLATCLVAVIFSFELLCVYAAFFGLFYATFSMLRSIVVVQLLGIEKLTNAFGLIFLFQGAACLGGTPMSGALLESTGSFVVPFMVSGCLIAAGGLICLPARRIARWEQERQDRKNRNVDSVRPTML